MKNITFPFTVDLAGDSIWDYKGPLTVTVSDIKVWNEDDEDYPPLIEVMHNTTWNIYTDTGFESAISEALGYAVTFTEQGMQENGCAEMELAA